MKKFLSAILAMIITLSLFTACSDKNEVSGEKQNDVTINVYNWGEFMDESLNDEFTEKTGIKVNYSTFDTNEALYAQLKNGGADYDVIFPSDYMVGRMIEENMIQKLDFNNIPNYKNIMDDFKNLPYDLNNEYSVPYSWGTVGIIYDSEKITEPVDSWDILWNDKYKNRILMFDNPRDTIGIALKKLGKSFNTTSEDDISAAVEELKKQKPLVQAYVMDQIFQKLGSGEADIGVYYAGDYITINKENPKMKFSIPKEGTNRFVDTMCIPVGSKHKKEAEAYINFMLEKESGIKNAEVIGYSTPNKLSYEALPDEIKNDGISYPSKEVLVKCEVFNNLPENTRTFYDQKWAELFSN